MVTWVRASSRSRTEDAPPPFRAALRHRWPHYYYDYDYDCYHYYYDYYHCHYYRYYMFV